MGPLVDRVTEQGWLSMVWVKGELLSELDAAGVDPTRQLERAAQANLFDRRDWFSLVAEHLPDAAPIIARASSEGALAWLYLTRNGNRVSGLSNWYTMAFRPVLAGDGDTTRHRIMLTAIARRLAAASPGIATITLSPVPTADGSADLIARAFAKGGWQVSRYQSSTSWTASVSDMSFDDYWAARPGQLRSTYKRRLGKANFETEVLDHFDEATWADYESIYGESWKPEEGCPPFLRALAEREGEAGCLRLGICRIDGVPVAAQFWTVENGRALIHKLAHRESAKEFSPGTILSHALFRHVIDQDHVDVIDFGTGDDPYKADWMDASTPLETITAHNPRTLAGLAGSAKTALSRLVRRAPSD
jgi:Acetyltransferase (GNAT) domain